MTKRLLSLEEDESYLGAFGIYSDAQAARFCYQLNEQSIWRFHRSQDFNQASDGRPGVYPHFQHSDWRFRVTLHLLGNKPLNFALSETPASGLFANLVEISPWINSKDHFDYYLWYEFEMPIPRLEKTVRSFLESNTIIKTFQKLSARDCAAIQNQINQAYGRQ